MRHNRRKKSGLPVLKLFFLLLVFAVAAGPGYMIINIPEAVAGSKKASARAAHDKQNKKEKQDSRENGEAAGTVSAEDKNASAPGEAKVDKEDIPLKDYTGEDFGPKAEDESIFWLFFKMIIVLGLLGGGFYYIFRFLGKKAGIQLLGGDVAQILSVVPIGQNKYLQIIDLAGRVLVLGISDTSINLVTEITDKDEIDRIRIKGQTRMPLKPEGFQEYLAKGIGRIIDLVNERKNKSRSFRQTGGFSAPGDDLDYLKDQRKRLKNLNGYDKE